MNLIDRPGGNGENGKAGNGGKTAMNGDTLDVVYSVINRSLHSSGSCKLESISITKGGKAETSENGIDGHNRVGLIQPDADLDNENPIHSIKNYKNFMEKYSLGNIRASALREFVEKLEKIDFS